jgi:hypothetical protein
LIKYFIYLKKKKRDGRDDKGRQEKIVVPHDTKRHKLIFYSIFYVINHIKGRQGRQGRQFLTSVEKNKKIKFEKHQNYFLPIEE